MIAKGVIFTTVGEGDEYYIPEDKMFIWDEMIERNYGDSGGFDVPEWATPVEGGVYIVDIKEKL